MINVILLLLLVDKLTAIAIILSVDCLHKEKEKRKKKITLQKIGYKRLGMLSPMTASCSCV